METGEGINDTDEVVVIEPSPTQFNPSMLPKTTQSSIFKAVNTQAHANRAKIWKLFAQMDSKVGELEGLEQEMEEGDSDDDYTESLRKELGDDMTKVKSSLASHGELSNNLQLMCSYMMDTRPNVPEANKLIKDAKTAFDKSINDEQAIEKKVKDWTAKNRNWLKNKRKEKKKETVESAKTTDSGGKARWLETFARELKPERNLKNDGDLTAMRAWKQSMIRYTNYIRKNNLKWAQSYTSTY